MKTLNIIQVTFSTCVVGGVAYALLEDSAKRAIETLKQTEWAPFALVGAVAIALTVAACI